MKAQAAAAAALLAILLACARCSGVPTVGVCYGRQADNLPSPQRAVQLIAFQGFSKVRLFSPDADALQALAGKGIPVIIGIPNAQVSGLANSSAAAAAWVANNVSPYISTTSITAIAVGNEVLTSVDDGGGNDLVAAMGNIYAALQSAGLDSSIKVSAPHAMGVLSSSFPPSSSRFDLTLAGGAVRRVLDFLSRTGSPFMVNAYPYYAYRNDPQHTALDFALLNSGSSKGFVDPNSGLRYDNLLDAQVDAVFYALAALNYRNIDVVVTETGWPSMGLANEVNVVNMRNAATYNNNVIRLVLDGRGTPFRPGQNVDVYIFELFNEDLRAGPTANRNWGLFNADGTRVYSLNWAGGTYLAPPAVTTPNTTFCVASASASFTTLQLQLDAVCDQVDCRPVQPGGRCYQPDTVASHASYAFNAYYQASGRNPAGCNFSGAGVITSVDPSYGKCIYVGSLSSRGTSRMQGAHTLLVAIVVVLWMMVVYS